MTETCYTARATLCTQIRDLINELPLHRNETGQYQHDDIVVFFSTVERVFKGLFNPLQPNQGMTDLLEEAPNTLNKIKSTDMADVRCGNHPQRSKR
jgi:hypothetical protein